jgi:DNA-binding Lrp family transcriptional regulator
MDDRFDDVDRRIVHRLVEDARHTSAPDIASELDVSAPTVRNRIRRLEEEGVILGYHAHVDYEKLGGRLTNLFLCTASATDRKRFAQRVLDVVRFEAAAGRATELTRNFRCTRRPLKRSVDVFEFRCSHRDEPGE